MANRNSSIFLKGFSQLEKLINNFFVVKVGRINKKLLNIRKDNLSVSLTGFTLIEALIVISIIAVLSVYYVASLRPNTLELLRMDNTRLAADIRYIRSMATSRAIYNNTTFPVDGYGILFKNGAGATKSYYQLYAGTKPNITVIKTVYLSNVAFRLVDSYSALSRSASIADTSAKQFSFLSENNIMTSGLGVSAEGDYQIEIYYDFTEGSQNYYYLAKLNIGRKTADNFVWSNLAITYETNTPSCGNHVVESGEACERVGLDGNINANCTPACQLNTCGDGYVMGTEQCDRGGAGSGLYCTPTYWCYTCYSMSGCINFNADGSIDTGNTSCCKGSDSLRDGYTCLSCIKRVAACPTSCSGGGGIGSEIIP